MHKLIIIFLAITILSCKKNDLKKDFNCGTSLTYSDTKVVQDVMKKFTIKFPKNWDTKLYYDEFQSEIYSADTSKSLTQTYILDVSWHQGELTFDKAFVQAVKDTLAIKEKVSVVKSNFIRFKEKSGYWSLSKGKTGKYTYHFLQVYIKTHVDEYFTFTTKIYGDDRVEERLCESIALVDGIEFLK